MDWKDKIKKGMKIIKEACQETISCCGCPFVKYCDILTESDDIHNEWIFEDDEDN